MTSLQQLSKCLYTWARTDEAFEILDRYIYGADWSQGGCVPLAIMLHDLMPGSELWMIGHAERRDTPQHMIVKWRGLFWDGRGGRKRRSVIKYWISELRGGPIFVAPTTPYYLANMVEWLTCPAELVDEMTASFLQHCSVELVGVRLTRSDDGR